MKSKPAILIYFSCLFSAALVFSLSGVALAEKKVPVKKDAEFWFNKGALLSTYGNHKAAVQYFQKAISLDPNFSKAYFSQGISYGQLDQYPKAIAQINMALKVLLWQRTRLSDLGRQSQSHG
jgi:tetratricopeptide (TPR) repeat protein